MKGDVGQVLGEDWDEGNSRGKTVIEQLESLEYFANHNQAGNCPDSN